MLYEGVAGYCLDVVSDLGVGFAIDKSHLTPFKLEPISVACPSYDDDTYMVLEVEHDKETEKWGNILGWVFIALIVVGYVGCDIRSRYNNHEKQQVTQAAPTSKYPDKVLIYSGEGVPNIYQRLTPDFAIEKALENSELGVDGFVKFVAFTAAANNKKCDQLNLVRITYIPNKRAFKVICLGDDGLTRFYKIWKFVDDPSSVYKMDYDNEVGG